LGKSRSYITNSLRLLKLYWIVQLDVLYKTITAWHGRCLLPLPKPIQFHFSNLIMDWHLSVAETRDQHVKKLAQIKTQCANLEKASEKIKELIKDIETGIREELEKLRRVIER